MNRMKMRQLYTRQGWLKNYGMMFIYPKSRVPFPLFVARFLRWQESSARSYHTSIRHITHAFGTCLESEVEANSQCKSSLQVGKREREQAVDQNHGNYNRR
ncbi:hypothetical protein AVEN_220210-1 [Araneus ventricosus]|uniref:Uncharacterized protein n=1 Tax=Araneus ventricosus TaxID=182803 RepID=A0A4Y2H003_ARAVE|nr:hypothetical protein AVEN_220210-1 [Araneus ventricosus]